ncbi:UNVERIFIED_CONTAM: hypothetical protein K2H54_060788 [Gekko kuhli]
MISQTVTLSGHGKAPAMSTATPMIQLTRPNQASPLRARLQPPPPAYAQSERREEERARTWIDSAQAHQETIAGIERTWLLE